MNIAAKSDGDLLVSSMYLPATAIRGSLARAGFSREVGLVTLRRQASRLDLAEAGRERVTIEEHLGDNAHSDAVA